MAVYKPKFRDPKTRILKQSRVYWYEFSFSGKRVRESAKTTRKTIALEAEKRRKLELERAYAGLPSVAAEDRVKSLGDVIQTYLKHYPADHSDKATVWASGCLGHVRAHLGNMLLPDLTENRVREYMVVRKGEGASNRTINMELGELSRAIGRTWSELWTKVNKLPERSDIGRALSAEEESRLLACAGAVSQNRAPLVAILIRLALSTAMRAGELTSLTWRQVDLFEGLLTVGKAKTESGTGRVVPMNNQVRAILSAHREWFVGRFGEPLPEHYLFPWGSPVPRDPFRPTVEIKTAWNTIRKAAGVDCRWHDLRHTAATKMAEAGVPESTMLALMGHMSRKMLERYSHIRMRAKREAVEALGLRTALEKVEVTEDSNVIPKDSPKVGRPNTIQ